jgi:formylglycine-generating enzyme required for sulfatase activity
VARARAATVVVLGVLACSRAEKSEGRNLAPAPSFVPVPSSSPPELLYVPSAEALLPPPVGFGFLPGAPRPAGRCPSEMVDVRGEFCIDRYEVQLFDRGRGEALSPYYHPTRAQTATSFAKFKKAVRAGQVALPEPPAFQLEHELEPVARSNQSVTPSGYLSGVVAKEACERAGKRLCAHAEWLTACRGQNGLPFPYGDRYRDGACNVHRETHPAFALHGDPSRNHLDPRLNRVADEDGPLLRSTGALATCRSEWGSDAVFDMVGNLDEWVADGGFAGGFYARATRDGCEARIRSHPPEYFDYSLGTRCCR